MMRENESFASLNIKDASYPQLFPQNLEFNAPAHGTWNTVHVAMQVPDAHQIYVCAINCMRGVIQTALEMNERDRFHFVLVEEKDVIRGSIERVTIDGTADVLNKLPKFPPIVFLFTVCTHRFLACDYEYVYRELGRMFPSVRFVRCYMEPITTKDGRVADTILREGIYEPLEMLPPMDMLVSILGGDFVLDEDCDLKRMLSSKGIQTGELRAIDTLEEYYQLAAARAFVAVFPKAYSGAQKTGDRLGREVLYLPSSFSYEECEEQVKIVSQRFGVEALDCKKEAALCEEKAAELKAKIGDTPVHIDYNVHPRVFGLAKYLHEHGFNVTHIYADTVSEEDRAAFLWLKENHPGLIVASCIQPEARIRPRDVYLEEKVLALGQLAAWFTSSGYFVNCVEGAGLQGFSGIRHMLDMMSDAFDEEKDYESLIPLKGMGCESCV